MEFEKITKDIYLLKTPFSIVWSGVVLINGETKVLIDSGNCGPEEYIIPALNKLGVSINDIDYLLCTHTHGDHIGGHYNLVKDYKIKTAVIKDGVENIKNPVQNAIRIRTKFPEHSPKPQVWLKGITPDYILKNNDILADRLKVIHTPGHDYDCVCWYDFETKTVITGDSLQGNGTPTQGIGFYRDLDLYRKTIDTLKKMDIENIICGHDYDGIGSVILGKENVEKALSACEEIVIKYSDLIDSYVKDGLTDKAEIANKLIEKAGCGKPENLFLALYTVNEHLKGKGIEL